MAARTERREPETVRKGISLIFANEQSLSVMSPFPAQHQAGEDLMLLEPVGAGAMTVDGKHPLGDSLVMRLPRTMHWPQAKCGVFYRALPTDLRRPVEYSVGYVTLHQMADIDTSINIRSESARSAITIRGDSAWKPRSQTLASTWAYVAGGNAKGRFILGIWFEPHPSRFR